MEETISGDTRTIEEHAKHHLTLEEQLAQLEAKEKKAKETEARRKAKMAKLRSALLLQKRETFDKVLSEHGIQTENQLREALALHAKLIGSGITTPGQLDKLIDLALQYDPDIIDGLTEENRQSEQGKELASRKRVQKLPISLDKIKVYMRGWLNYYGIADMKKLINGLNQWLYHRIRMCIWKHWKKPRTKIRNLQKLGAPFDLAYQAGNCRRGYWWTTNTLAVKMAMTKERLIRFGFYDLAEAYQSVHVNY